MRAKSTGCLIAHAEQRLPNLRIICEGMLAMPFIDEVLIYDNTVSHRTQLDDCIRGLDGVTVVGDGIDNCYTLGRYRAAAVANNGIIATCDDDSLVSNWLQLYDLYMKHDGKLVCNLPASHSRFVGHEYAHTYNWGTAHETLVGWGAIFHRDDISVLDLYREQWGEDDLLQRKADRIFTILLDRPHITLEGVVNHMTGASQSHALYHMDDHYRLNRVAAKRAIKLLDFQREAKL